MSKQVSVQVKAPKIGQGHVQGFFRQGGKEVAQALPAFPDSIRPVEEPGLFGNPVSQTIYQQGQGPAQEPELELSM